MVPLQYCNNNCQTIRWVYPSSRRELIGALEMNACRADVSTKDHCNAKRISWSCNDWREFAVGSGPSRSRMLWSDSKLAWAGNLGALWCIHSSMLRLFTEPRTSLQMLHRTLPSLRNIRKLTGSIPSVYESSRHDKFPAITVVTVTNKKHTLRTLGQDLRLCSTVIFLLSPRADSRIPQFSPNSIFSMFTSHICIYLIFFLLLPCRFTNIS